MSSQCHSEILLQDDNRYVMFPIKSQSVWDMYKKALESFWRCEEVDLSPRDPVVQPVHLERPVRTHDDHDEAQPLDEVASGLAIRAAGSRRGHALRPEVPRGKASARPW